MESAIANWKNLRNGVVVSVVMLYLVEPAMKLLVDVFPHFGGRVYRWVWDHAAIQAAIGGDYVDFALFAILFSAIVGTFIGRYGMGAHTFAKRGRRASDSPWSRWEKRLVLLLLLLSGPVAAGTLLVDFAAQQMKLSFEQRMAVLAPAISEDDEEALRGRFADMDGRNSYESLKLDMDMMARASRVSLPDPLL
jgi:ABC-type Fe3+ transport system permease subunit